MRLVYDCKWFNMQSVMYVYLLLGYKGKGLVVENCGDQADNMSQNREHDGTMTPD